MKKRSIQEKTEPNLKASLKLQFEQEMKQKFCFDDQKEAMLERWK